MGTPNREPQEYSRYIVEYKDPGSYIPIIFLLYSWGSLFRVPIKVPLQELLRIRGIHAARLAAFTAGGPKGVLLLCRVWGLGGLGFRGLRFRV